MSEFTLGFVLALLCAISWAVLDVSRKQMGRKMTATGAAAGLMCLHIVLINPLLLTGSLTEGDGALYETVLVGYPELSVAYFWPTAVSVVLNLAANFLFFRAVQLSPLGLTIPYLAFTPVFTALTALIFLGQVPTSSGWMGIAVVCLGAFFINPGQSADGALAPLKALWTERGSFYMLIVALLWSVTPILDKTAAELTSPMWHTMFLAGTVGVVFVAYRGVVDSSLRPLWKEFRAIPLWLIMGGFFATAAMVLQLTSYVYIDVAYVETIKRAIGVTAAIVVGFVIFGERDLRRRLLGALIMSLGVALILLAG